MPIILEEDWLNLGATTKWPFSESALLANAAGMSLSNAMFLDAAIYPVGMVKGAYISKITVLDALVTITLGEEAVELCSATFDRFAAEARLPLVDAYGRPAGLLLAKSLALAEFQTWDDGEYKFLRTQTEFAGGVCIPRPERGLSGIVLESGELFTGDIHLVASDGVIFERFLANRSDGACLPYLPVEAITVHVVGDPLHVRHGCDLQAASGLFSAINPLQRLVIMQAGPTLELVPDANGGVTIFGGSELTNRPALRVKTESQGIGISFIEKSA